MRDSGSRERPALQQLTASQRQPQTAAAFAGSRPGLLYDNEGASIIARESHRIRGQIFRSSLPLGPLAVFCVLFAAERQGLGDDVDGKRWERRKHYHHQPPQQHNNNNRALSNHQSSN
jgi:hypothetical protein